MGDVIGFLKKMFYHGCNSTENSNAKTDHSFWVYPALKPTVNSWDTHLPVGLYCNNHALLGSCVEDMSLTEFECMGHSSEEDSAVVYTGALPQSRSVSPALSSASGASTGDAGAVAGPGAGPAERTVSPSSDAADAEESFTTAEDLANVIASYTPSTWQPVTTTQDSNNDKAITDLLDRITKLEQRQQYNTVYRIVAELFALLLLSLYFLKSTPHVATSSRDVDL